MFPELISNIEMGTNDVESFIQFFKDTDPDAMPFNPSQILSFITYSTEP